ncbi:MAG: hypothetical protein J7J80_08425 [Thermotogae bacterium]|nr:hypothetical protein [Thermotogota bacterium]
MNRERREYKKYLIATACNKKYENFLLNHWFKSLKDNVNLSQIDILVIDYDLSTNVVEKLKEKGVLIKKARLKDGIINNLRFLEIRDFVNESPGYEKILVTDSGDLIFQTDISSIFEIHENLAGVVEQVSPAIEMLVNKNDIDNYEEIMAILEGERLINVGFILFSRKTFLEVVELMEKVAKNLNAWGIDTVVPNYYAYKNGFHVLHEKYNFIPTTARKKYKVKNGKFYLVENDNLEMISVVHNAGRHRILRPIMNFGYGEDHNIPKPFTVFILRTFYSLLSFLRSKK